MSASASSSNRLLAAALLVLGACVDREPVHERTTSLRVTVTSPTDLGSEASRLPDGTRDLALAVQALDEQGQLDRGFSAPVDVLVHTLGSLSPTAIKIDLASGMGAGRVTVPVAFGKTFLWLEDVEDGSQHTATFATGTSPILWYREPFISDISTPDPTTSVASQLRFSPLTGKQVRVSGSRHGAAGKLLVTGVYADGFSLSDADCSAAPCVPAPYGHVYVFSFGRPVDVRGRPIAVGQTLKWVEGAVAEFNGFTELNFPTQEIDDATPDPALLPVPVAIDKEWLRSGGSQNLLKMEEQEAGLMSVSGASVCTLDNDYDRFKQWKVNIGLGCGTAVNVITSGTIATFDPAAYVGKTIPRIVGTLKTVNLSGFNVWILLPRSAADLVLN